MSRGVPVIHRADTTWRWLWLSDRICMLGRPASESSARIRMLLWKRSKDVRERRPKKVKFSICSILLPCKSIHLRLDNDLKAFSAIPSNWLYDMSRIFWFEGNKSRNGGAKSFQSNVQSLKIAQGIEPMQLPDISSLVSRLRMMMLWIGILVILLAGSPRAVSCFPSPRNTLLWTSSSIPEDKTLYAHILCVQLQREVVQSIRHF